MAKLTGLRHYESLNSTPAGSVTYFALQSRKFFFGKSLKFWGKIVHPKSAFQVVRLIRTTVRLFLGLFHSVSAIFCNHSEKTKM